MKALPAILIAASLAILPGCMRHSVETTNEIKPIHIVIDVNVKVDKALDNFFAPQDGSSAAMPQAVSFEDALKPVDAKSPPPKEVMMGRFIARNGEIKKLKAKGLLGEDAKGFLLFVSDVKESENVVAAENADRAVVYERVAKGQGSTPEKVAQLKAQKNANEAKSGEFVQDASGKWSQKK